MQTVIPALVLPILSIFNYRQRKKTASAQNTLGLLSTEQNGLKKLCVRGEQSYERKSIISKPSSAPKHEPLIVRRMGLILG